MFIVGIYNSLDVVILFKWDLISINLLEICYKGIGKDIGKRYFLGFEILNFIINFV